MSDLLVVLTLEPRDAARCDAQEKRRIEARVAERLASIPLESRFVGAALWRPLEQLEGEPRAQWVLFEHWGEEEDGLGVTPDGQVILADWLPFAIDEAGRPVARIEGASDSEDEDVMLLPVLPEGARAPEPDEVWPIVLGEEIALAREVLGEALLASIGEGYDILIEEIWC